MILFTLDFLSRTPLQIPLYFFTGALGFLVYDSDDGRVDGNMGIKDQQQALIWIQKNIQQFGGDKNKVTFIPTVQIIMISMDYFRGSEVVHVIR